MNTMPSRTALTLIAALLAAPAVAGAGTPEPGGDPALRVEMNQSSHASLPIFLLEVEALAGFEFEGQVRWTANEQELGIEPVQTLDGLYLDVYGRPMFAEAIVCAELTGRLSLGGDLGRDVREQVCVIYIHDDAPVQPTSADKPLQKEELSRRPGSRIQPHDAAGRSLERIVRR